MLEQRQVYCWSDPVFFDTPNRWESEEGPFEFASRDLPEGWSRFRRDVWVVVTPQGHAFPPQGWKVHVSATMESAPRVLAAVWEYCLAGGIPFKFLRDRNMLLVYNSKYVPRESSGKFITIYPADEAELRTVLEGLARQLEGERGPYILSDLRWGTGPLFVRYGSFTERYCMTEDGDFVLAIERPDGVLVPDRRRPVFEVPPWVTTPDFLAPHLAARRSGGAEQFPYRIERALHFSNGGGVYLARRIADGREVVLKEARPFAGLDRQGRDAVARLECERWALERLSGIAGIPQLYEHFTVWEHQFLAVEYVEGDMCWVWLGREHPLLQADPTVVDAGEFTRRGLAVVARLEALVGAMHERGVVFGDLHPGNVLVGPDDSVALVDFEMAGPVDSDRPPLGALGFTSWQPRTGPDVDRFALAAFRLWMFLPLNRVYGLDPRKADQYVAEIQRRFALPAEYCQPILAELRLTDERAASAPVLARGERLEVDLDAPEPDWQAVRKSLTEAILASATPERTDRLFPGDLRQFTGDGVGFGYGAAGVLWALSVTGAGRYREHDEWLLEAVRRGLRPRPGFYLGLHGVAYVLDHLGHAEAALQLLDRAAEHTPALRDVTLFGGLAGVGLGLLHFARRTGTQDLRSQALDVAARLGAAIRDAHGPGYPEASKAGLLRGWSGPALFFLRLYEDTGDPDHLELAVRALHRDLDACVTAGDGTIQVEEAGVRTLVYLEIGSAGIGLVAHEVLQHSADPRLLASIEGLRRACQLEFVLETHLFNGRAGLLAALATMAPADPGTEAGKAVARHLRHFSWNALPYHGHLAFPGDQAYRLSMDLGTGNAGVLLSISTVLERTPFLPFLNAPTRTGAPSGDGDRTASDGEEVHAK